MNIIIENTSKVIGARLHPESDLLCEIKRIAKENHVTCGIILALVGSVRKGTTRRVLNCSKKHLVYNEESGLREDGHRVYDLMEINRPLEIVSANGTISENQDAHVHIVFTDGNHVYAGHLVEGNPIYTTAELFLMCLPNVTAKRVFDPNTGHRELELLERVKLTNENS